MHDWLLLHYKIPREPSAGRVYIWRKLKRIGAILLHDSIWVLPARPRTQEQFQWIAAEIAELEGEALVWESRLALTGQYEEALIRQFMEQVEAEYRKVLVELERNQAGPGKVGEADSAGGDLALLSRRYLQIKGMDFFQSELGKRVRQALLTARGETEL